MKTSIRVFIAILALALLVNISCRKNGNSDLVSAVITGFDPRMCACCGWLMINFEGQTGLYSPEWYAVKNDPASLGISGNSTFPIYADVTYVVEDPAGCGYKGFVRVTNIVKK